MGDSNVTGKDLIRIRETSFQASLHMAKVDWSLDTEKRRLINIFGIILCHAPQKKMKYDINIALIMNVKLYFEMVSDVQNILSRYCNTA